MKLKETLIKPIFGKLSKRASRSRAPFVIIPITLLTVAAITLLLRYLEPASTKDVILFSINVCLVLLPVLVFFIIRSLYKIYGEGAHQRFGSGFETRLVIAFVGFILVPSILLFILSSLLITYTVDKWFKLEFQIPIKNSMKMANVFYSREIENVLKSAKVLAQVDNQTLESALRDIVETNRFLNDSTKTYILTKTDGSPLVNKAFRGYEGHEESTTKAGKVLKAAAPVIHGDKVVEVVVAETLLDAKLVEKIDSIIDAYNTDYKQIENQQKSIQILYFLVLAVITMLIIYLSIWISIRIARSITVPITTLASAANAVAKGDMNVKIEMARKDEVGVLIDSFNAMVNELREGKLSLEQAYREADRGRLSLTAILQNINTGVIFLDNKRNILTANAAACSILSLEIHDIIGQDYRKILSKIESEELHDLIRRINETKFDYIEQEIIGLIDKKLMTIRIQIMALKDSQHISMGILVVFDDLTEIVKAQRALAWQEVARRIAHEIKNPLTPIKLSTERLIRKKEQQAPDFDNVFNRATKTIIKEVESLKNLVNEFARFGTMPAVHKQPGNINLLIEAALELYNDYKGVHFEKLFETVPELSFDHEQFKRMIINLIDNAIHAKAERIELATSFNPQFESVSIEVRDNGVGVKDEDKSKLFLPYFSTKKSGTGLGLAIVDKVVSEHRGYMRVKDNEPRGTIFAIELPIKA